MAMGSTTSILKARCNLMWTQQACTEGAPCIACSGSSNLLDVRRTERLQLDGGGCFSQSALL